MPSPEETPKTFARALAAAQRQAWLPPALLLLALSSVFLLGGDRGYFHREFIHNLVSAKTLAIAENLSSEHHFLMFTSQTIDAAGNTVYRPYNRFPIGGYALIKLTILPFGDDLSAKIYAARILTLLFFAAAACLAYLSLRRIASSRWIALTATLLAFSSVYCLYYSDMISNEVTIDLFAVILAFHGMVVFEQDGRFRQLLLKACAALLLGWHAYALLLPFIAFGLMRELITARSSGSPISGTSFGALYQLRHTALSLMRSRYLTLGMATLLFGISTLAVNFTNEYFALNRETPLTELPSVMSMLNRTGVGPYFREDYSEWLSWSAFPERQFYRVGAMSLPYALSPSNSEAPHVQYPGELPLSFVILGIAASGASLIGLLFIRRHKILLAALALSGFCWALPMRHHTATPWHNFETVFYIGVALTLFTLGLLCLRKLSGERFIVAMSVAALLIFVVSALGMSQLNNPNQTAQLHQASIDDFESIRNMTDGKVTHIGVMPKFHKGVTALIHYYLSGRTTISAYKTPPFARTPDFVVTGIRVYGLASLTPQNRIVFLYEWDGYHKYIDKTIEQVDNLIIHSDFDVYLNGDNLLYVKDDCGADGAEPRFFLALYPADESDLPAERRRHNFANLDFEFNDNAIRSGERCIAIAQLPDYDIARIYTGQYIQLADNSTAHLWEGDVRLTEATR